MSARTFVVGDIHGDLEALTRLLDKLPTFTTDDTLVFLGDYVDRGPHPKGVVDLIRGLSATTPAKVVCLRGNHEDEWCQSYESPHAPFLVQVANGCAATFRSFSGGKPLESDEETIHVDEYPRMLDVASWFPADVVEWMKALPLWHEDDHGIYVHAGLQKDGAGGWKHPRDCDPQSLLWMREPSFYEGYEGKRLVFGHTLVKELPLGHLGTFKKLFDDPNDVWVRGQLIGLDTGAGKGGFLSAVELPSMKVYESR